MDLKPSRDLVLKKLRDGFPDPTCGSEALEVLDSYGSESWHRERERVQLAALKVAAGRIRELRAAINLAKQDYRDVLVAAEYPKSFPYDFTKLPQARREAIQREERADYERWLLSDAP